MSTQQGGSRIVAVLGAPGGLGAVFADLLGAVAELAVVEKPAAVDDDLLEVLRATRTAPPELRAGWEQLPDVVALADRGRAALDQRDAVWFDTATAPLFAFWTRHVAAPDLCVVVADDPGAVVATLQRDGLEPAHAEALQAVAARAARRAAADLPTVVVDPISVAADPEAELERFARACAAAGVSFDAADGVAWWRAHGPTIDPATARLDASTSADGTVPEWCDELLRLHLQVHRAGLDARATWLAAGDEPELEHAAALAAVEREAALLRDRVIGLEAERANLSATMVAIDGLWRAAEQRADAVADRLVELDLDELEHARHQRDQMLASPQWQVGRAVVGPVRRLRRWFRGSS